MAYTLKVRDRFFFFFFPYLQHNLSYIFIHIYKLYIERKGKSMIKKRKRQKKHVKRKSCSLLCGKRSALFL